ncbi:MAG: shikimate kinase [Treponema sp.]|nr:shikimate kinase [Treponema sp.]
MEDIILTGPKHSGKTSAGKALAPLCSGGFFDIDEKISQITGKTPRELYSEGKVIFQKAEAEAVAALFPMNCCDNASPCCAGQRRRIIAAGGGIIDNQEAVGVLKNSGAKIVYLNINANLAWRRIYGSGKKELPPFLQTENPRETHRVLHERRSAAYIELADIIIEAEDKKPEEIATEILKHIS